MDNTDIKILNILRHNARANASEISEGVRLSVSAVIERIRKLENAGILKAYTTVLDNKKVAKDVVAFVTVSIEHPKYNSLFEGTVKRNSSITECHYIAGDVDYIIKIVVDNTYSLERVLYEIKSCEGVSKTKTSIVLCTNKLEYSIKLDEV